MDHKAARKQRITKHVEEIMVGSDLIVSTSAHPCQLTSTNDFNRRVR